MKKNIKLFIVTIATLALSACGGSQNKKAAETTEAHETTIAVTLNNGEKWNTNPETDTGIVNMKELVDHFTGNENIDAYHVLKTGLEKEFNTVIEKCSMKGEAHEQLHNYLLPMRPMFDSLGSNKIETCKTGFTQIKNHLAEYTNYFE